MNHFCFLMQLNARCAPGQEDAAPMDLERRLYYQREGGASVGVCASGVLKV